MKDAPKQSVSAEKDAGRVIKMNATLPTLYIPYPQCDHCGEDVTIEDGSAWCEGCLIEWAHIVDGEPAKPDTGREGTDVPCDIVAGKQNDPHDDKRGYHYEPGPPQPCILPSGHESDHVCPYDVRVTAPERGDRA